jgi:hypothetical protein
LIFAGISWWMLRRRRQRMTVRPQHRDLLIESSMDEKLPRHSFFDAPSVEKGEHRRQKSDSPFNRVVLSFASSKDSGPPSPVERFITQPHRPSLPPLDPPPQIRFPPNIKRSNSSKSLDSESLYSASSAPRSDVYETSYQPWSLPSIPGSPNAASFPMPPRRGPLHLVDQSQAETDDPQPGSSVTAIREALAPETYAAHRRPPSDPAALSHGPLLTPLPAPPRTKGKRRSRSDIVSGYRNTPLPPTPEAAPSQQQSKRPYLAPLTIPSSSPSTSRPLPVPGARK